MERRRPLTVLLVEDHDAFALTLATVLATDPRIEIVDRAADGRAGVDLALLHQPDVVLMDIYMPNLDGIDATRELTELLPETAVLILSSTDVEGDVERALAAGASGFLPKDARLPELIDAIVTCAPEHAAADDRGLVQLHGTPRPRPTRRLCL